MTRANSLQTKPKARFYFPGLASRRESDTIEFDKALVKHARAMRLAEGDAIVLFDGKGLVANATLIASSAGCLLGEHPRNTENAERSPAISLIQCLPKGDKVESIVSMCTELGVRSIHLAISERTIARPEASRSKKRLDRLHRIAEEAAAVGGQPFVPDILEPAALLEVARRAGTDATKIVFWEESTAPLSSLIPTLQAAPVWIVIGPEGGLSASEVTLLKNLGFMDASLGPWVLRVQTASPVAVVMVSARAQTLNLR